MSISYTSALARNGKGAISYDSDDWFINRGIARAPKEGIFTRQKNYVSDSSTITQQIEESGDRITENILTFPRQINPMVSMQYSNADGKPAKLPYTILRDGAFRPPIRMFTELTPLSRLPHQAVELPGRIGNMIPTDTPKVVPTNFPTLETPLNVEVDRNFGPPQIQPPEYVEFNRAPLVDLPPIGNVFSNQTAIPVSGLGSAEIPKGTVEGLSIGEVGSKIADISPPGIQPEGDVIEKVAQRPVLLYGESSNASDVARPGISPEMDYKLRTPLYAPKTTNLTDVTTTGIPTMTDWKLKSPPLASGATNRLGVPIAGMTSEGFKALLPPLHYSVDGRKVGGVIGGRDMDADYAKIITRVAPIGEIYTTPKAVVHTRGDVNLGARPSLDLGGYFPGGGASAQMASLLGSASKGPF